MSGRLWGQAGLLGLAVLGVGFGLVSRGQVRPVEPADPALRLESSKLRVEEWLDREVAVPFDRETSLADVSAHLAKSLGIRVVLDPAAFNRLGIGPDEPIRLSVDGPLRLRTALPLILDQVDLTYKFVPEDRLLLLTDGIGAHDGHRQLLEEIREMHRELHDLSDALFDILDRMEADEGDQPPEAAPAADPARNRSS